MRVLESVVLLAAERWVSSGGYGDKNHQHNVCQDDNVRVLKGAWIRDGVSVSCHCCEQSIPDNGSYPASTMNTSVVEDLRCSAAQAKGR